MFVLRAVYGTHKGEYYAGLRGMSPVWSDHQGAERVSGSDAAGIVMAMIDMPRIVVVPERLPDTTEEECQSFVDQAAHGMFQNPSDTIKFCISKTIRSSADVPIHEQTQDLPTSTDYMSVFEWVARAVPKDAFKNE